MAHMRTSAMRIGLAATAVAALTVTGCAPGGGGDDSSSATGGTAIIALTQEPGVFNPMFSLQSGSTMISESFVVEPLFLTKADGTYEPYLAAEIPSIENGGISEDGLTVTFTLNEGITWSDGESFTAEDLEFTVEVAQNPEGAAQAATEYYEIEDTTVVDDLTLEVQFSQPTPSYWQLFQHVLPEHRFDTTAIEMTNPEISLAMGTGPFMFDEWDSGSEVSLVKNENYWRDPSLPKLDGVTVRIVPDTQTAIGGMVSGDYDTLAIFTSGDMTQIEQALDSGAPITVHSPDSGGYVEWLWINHSDNGDLSTPHPILGDLAIRQAIDAGVDRQAIIDEVLGGYGALSGAFVYAGFGAVESEPTAYDPAQAEQILEDAGWLPGADGIREKDGVRASLRFQTIAGDQVRSLYQQIIQQNLEEIGIETVIENVPSNSLFDSRSEGGLLANGQFDIVMSRDGFFPDPTLWVDVFSTSHIPDENTPGISYSHWSNDEYDALNDQVASTMDVDERQEVVRQVDELFTSQVIAVPLYASGVYYPFNDALENVTFDGWNGWQNTQSTAEWTLAN